MDICKELHGTRVLICGEDGPMLAGERDVGDFLGAAWAEDASLVAIPTARIGADFFRLRTRVAGEIVQKFVNYRIRLAIIGDISAPSAESQALRDFVHEANQGEAFWFLDDLAALEHRLAARS